MTLYQGYILLPTNSYFAWKNTVNGNGYDADRYYGYQCWDLCAEFWWNLGFPPGYPLTGPNHSAYECWTVNRYNNLSYGGTTYFQLVENFTQVKQGDIVVLGTTWSSEGHIGFADEDYNGTNTMAILGQNQGTGGTPIPYFPPAGGSTANVKSMNVGNHFLGAFRYLGWAGPQPSLRVKRKKGSTFPWAIYARKLRDARYHRK